MFDFSDNFILKEKKNETKNNGFNANGTKFNWVFKS